MHTAVAVAYINVSVGVDAEFRFEVDLVVCTPRTVNKTSRKDYVSFDVGSISITGNTNHHDE